MGAQTTVAVIGAKGRMGATVCRAVTAAPDLRLVGEYDQGDDLGDLGGAQVVVEFSVPDASLGNVMACVQRGVHGVVCLLYTSPSPRDRTRPRMPSSA